MKKMLSRQIFQKWICLVRPKAVLTGIELSCNQASVKDNGRDLHALVRNLTNLPVKMFSFRLKQFNKFIPFVPQDGIL